MSRFLCFFIWNLLTKKKYRIQTFRENNAWRRIGFEQYISFTWYWKYVLIVGNRALLLVCSIGKSVLKDIEAHWSDVVEAWTWAMSPWVLSLRDFFWVNPQAKWPKILNWSCTQCVYQGVIERLSKCQSFHISCNANT